MNIKLGPLGPISHTLENQITRLFSMNPNTQTSCNTVAQPDAKSPAQRIMIHAVSNGWQLSVDHNGHTNWRGQEMPQFVYNDADAVAGAVRGLIVKGEPEPAWVGSPLDPRLRLERELKESNTVRSELCAQVEGLKRENDSLTKKAHVTIASLDSAFKEGESAGFKKSEANIYSRRPWNEIALLTKERDTLKEGLNAASIKITALEICGQTKTSDYHQGFDDGKVKVKAEMCVFVRGLNERIDKLTAEVEDARKSRRTATEVQADANLISIQGAEIHRLRGLLDEAQAGNRARDAAIEGLRGNLDSERAGVRALLDSQQTGNLLIEAGDVWRSSRPSGNIVRCIISVSNGSVKYCFRTNGGTLIIKTRSLSRLCDRLRQENAVVTRNSFVPAQYSVEPVEGFMVGDVWTKSCGGTRTIVAVSDTSVSYDYRHSPEDNQREIITIRRKTDSKCVANGATLVRK